jgi:hypothetical protein
MSYKGCEDCGCRVYNGICTNCQEELWIEETQTEFLPELSEEWKEKVSEQRNIVANKKL